MKSKPNVPKRETSAPRNESEKKLLKKISKKIRSDLHEMGKTLEWLGWESDTSRSTIRRILEAEKNMGLLTLDRISKALGHKGVEHFLREI